MIARLSDCLRDMIPVPLAAPETQAMKAARLSLLAALGILAVIGAWWGALHALLGIGAVALFAGTSVYLAVRGPIYLAAKTAADNAWLFSPKDDEEAGDDE